MPYRRMPMRRCSLRDHRQTGWKHDLSLPDMPAPLGRSGDGLAHRADEQFQVHRWQPTNVSIVAAGVEVILRGMRNASEDLERAFEASVQQHVRALVVGIDDLTLVHRRIIVDLAAKHRLPAIYASREFVDAGGLMTYGVNYPHLYRRAATYVDKIFRGAKPADLPIEQPTQFELIINRKTAHALGLTIPPSLLLRADHIIE